MDQQKTGEFLKHLRKQRGLTQEQLAEHFCVSSRSVSRWETGNNMPDLDTLIELADFYDVGIREIIEGERKSENMDKETKDTLKKVAEYAAEEKKQTSDRFATVLGWLAVLLVVSALLFQRKTQGLLYGIVPKNICIAIVVTVESLCMIVVLLSFLHMRGALDKFTKKKKAKR